jgi:sugar lactone lactonase YvrE
MTSRRLLLVILGLVIVILLALGGFYLYLSGGQDSAGDTAADDDSGLIHVRTIYTYGDDIPILRPVGAAVDESGDIYVTLRDDATVVKFDSDGDYITHWGERGAQPGQMLSPMNLAADSLADHVYVADRARLRLIAYTTDGEYLWETPLLSPLAPAVDPDGQLAVATFGPLVSMSGEGEVLEQHGTRGLTPGQFDFPRSVDIDDDGNVYVADTNNTRVQRVQRSGDVTATVDWVLGEPPRFQDDPDTRFVVPSGVTVDDNGRVVVLDGFKHTITLIDKETGEEIHEFPERQGPTDGSFQLPTAISHIGGDSFVVTDTFNDRVQIIRLLAPEENNIFSRNPWLLWLLPLLLLPLLFFLFRKRYFATEELLTRAVDEGNARLVLAVASKLRVLPDVYEKFKDVAEEDVVIGEYLEPVDAKPTGDMDSSDEALLAKAAERSVGQKILLARHRVLCIDAEQGQRMAEMGAHPVSYDEILEDYKLES